MRLIILALIATLGLPATAVGQAFPSFVVPPLIGPTWGGYPPRDLPPSFAIPSLIRPPSDLFPLASMGLPLPPIGLQGTARRSVFRGHPGPASALTSADRFGAAGTALHKKRHHSRQQIIYWPIFVAPQMTMAIASPIVAEPFGAEAANAAKAAAVEREPATGQLFLEVTPGNAQVFVDGYYVGTPEDVGATGRGIILEAGPYRVDISAPGHEPVVFDVMISSNRAITYRRVMKSSEPAPTPQPSVPATPRTFYLIPGCYMGDVPPKDAKLPPTCDITRAITYSIP